MVEIKKENDFDKDYKDEKENRKFEPEQFRKLFVGGLSLNTTDDGLKEFYSQFGELLDCIVMRDGESKKSRGFGFVTFALKEQVDKAMKARPHQIDGKTVDPKRAVPRDQSNRSESNVSTKRLYVSGVRESHTEEDFKNHFSSFGDVLKVEIILDKVTQKPRGFAFISFEDYDSVDQCVLKKSHMVNGYRCDVKKALSKEEIGKAQQLDRDRIERGNRSRGNQRYFNNNNRNGGYGPWSSGSLQSGWGGVPQGQWGPPGGSYGGYGSGYGGNSSNNWGNVGNNMPNWGGIGGTPILGNYPGGNSNWNADAPVSSNWPGQPILGNPVGGSQWGAGGGWQSGGASERY